MRDKKYYGNQDQIMGVEEYRLIEGKGKDMRMMHIRNGKGLEVYVCPDRCLDITRVTLKGDNLSYFSPAGYVAPTYYDANQSEMIRSFTGGFLTTCGFDNVGDACKENGVNYPLHGRISNEPAYHSYWKENVDSYEIYALMKQEYMTMEHLTLSRCIKIEKGRNKIHIEDMIENHGSKSEVCMLLYHMNMGYPLLSEEAILTIPSETKVGRTKEADKILSHSARIDAPNNNNLDCCYFHQFQEEGVARLYNPQIKKGVEIRFDPRKLPCFTQWNHFHEYDYVLGLEPGNTFPIGRKKAIQDQVVPRIEPGEQKEYWIDITFTEV